MSASGEPRELRLLRAAVRRAEAHQRTQAAVLAGFGERLARVEARLSGAERRADGLRDELARHLDAHRRTR